MDAPPNACGPWVLTRPGDEDLRVDLPAHPHRMYAEFVAFEQLIEALDFAERDRRLDHSAVVLHVVLDALAEAGVQLG
jgi:hypothetical protein